MVIRELSYNHGLGTTGRFYEFYRPIAELSRLSVEQFEYSFGVHFSCKKIFLRPSDITRAVCAEINETMLGASASMYSLTFRVCVMLP